MTSEMDSNISNKVRFDRNSVEQKVRSMIANKDYGLGISYWGQVIICCSPEFYEAGFFKEIKKYTKKDTEVELRLRIDYETMLKGDEKEVLKLICKSILRGVDIAENELKIKDFNFPIFREDLQSLFKKEGWL